MVINFNRWTLTTEVPQLSILSKVTAQERSLFLGEVSLKPFMDTYSHVPLKGRVIKKQRAS